uniref:NADH-ubiquinone oxidoreductase chain 6 n=1 Tax=Stenopsyche tienmushanensis TaxID=1560151 RepID=A0A8A0Y6H7_9NEOP|nr:NADH dehydrogenase subunit 6 [Stenopsyche tienmushanensis]QSQ87277.1 NADH dehydrogenase subunit 6 [Stenopsyche tienmushanensis]UDU84914.1 NADH dehydrogenase subunit 6 [Stenopsyche tienmushanensis]
MMKFMLINLMMMMNMMFSFLKHPMSMGLLILMQLLVSCLLMNLKIYFSWFSYIMFLILIGGLLILFMYMCTISTNKMLVLSMKLMISMFFFFFFFSLLSYFYYSNPMNYNNNNMSISHMTMFAHKDIMLNKMFNAPSNYITIILMIYLFIILIIINKMMIMKMGPLRKN